MQLLVQADMKVSSDRRVSFNVYDQPSAIPTWGRPLRLWVASDMEPISKALAELRRLVSKVAVGIGELLVARLERLLYVGPLRVVPPRSYRPPLTEDLSRWAEGLGAWDALYRRGPTFVSRVSEWMKRLGTGYRAELQASWRFRTPSKKSRACWSTSSMLSTYTTRLLLMSRKS